MYTIAEDEDYLQVTEITNYNHPIIQKVADELKALYETDVSLTKAAFEFVRDKIDHSFDIDVDENCRALQRNLPTHIAQPTNVYTVILCKSRGTRELIYRSSAFAEDDSVRGSV